MRDKPELPKTKEKRIEAMRMRRKQQIFKTFAIRMRGTESDRPYQRLSHNLCTILGRRISFPPPPRICLPQTAKFPRRWA